MLIRIETIFFLTLLILLIILTTWFCKCSDTNSLSGMQFEQDSIDIGIHQESYICSCKPKLSYPVGDRTIAFQGKYYGKGIYSNCDERYLLQFDLGTIAINTKIDSALLQLYCIEMHGRPVKKMIYELIAQQWQHDIMSFNTKPATDTLGRIITDWPTAKQWHNIDITSLVKGWVEMNKPNYGIMCYSMDVPATSSAIFSTSKNSNTNTHPKLRIWYHRESGIK